MIYAQRRSVKTECRIQQVKVETYKPAPAISFCIDNMTRQGTNARKQQATHIATFPSGIFENPQFILVCNMGPIPRISVQL
jgi:hypothetical protein